LPQFWIFFIDIFNLFVAGGLRQTERLREHQSFQEASLLSKPAATQQTPVQRLSPENKGGFPYIPFSAGYRMEGGGTACPIHKSHVITLIALTSGIK
jgi:hypothetical protein